MAGRSKLGFVLPSPVANPLASSRTSVINMIPYLERAGFDTSIVFEPEAPTEVPDVTSVAARLPGQEFDIVYFQKVRGPSVLRMIATLSAAGTRTVYGVCDRVDPAMVRATDLTISVTEFLRQLHPVELRHRIRVVHDGIERPQAAKTRWGDHAGTRARPLKLVLVTSADLNELPVLGRVPDWASLTIVGRYPRTDGAALRARKMRDTLRGNRGAVEKLRCLRFLLDSRVTLVPWHADRVYDQMVEADIGILPIGRRDDGAPGPASWKLKSENRLTMKMAIGLPVVATPIPSYLPVAADGQNALLAEDVADWRRGLEQLRSPTERRRMGDAARASVLEPYSKEAQALRLVEALRSVLP